MSPTEANVPEWHVINNELPLIEPLPELIPQEITFSEWDTGHLDNCVSQYPTISAQPIYQGGVSYTEGILPESESYLIPLKAKHHAASRKKPIKTASKKSKPTTPSSSLKKKGALKATKKTTKTKSKPKSKPKTIAKKPTKHHHKR